MFAKEMIPKLKSVEAMIKPPEEKMIYAVVYFYKDKAVIAEPYTYKTARSPREYKNRITKFEIDELFDGLYLYDSPCPGNQIKRN